MSDLQSLLPTILADRFAAHSRRIHELAASLDDDQFWKKPFPFGNSFGHLVLHLTGNLSYYIGAQIAKTGYVRDRPREFADANPPSKAEALRRFDDAVAIAVHTARKQSAEDWVADSQSPGDLPGLRQPLAAPYWANDLPGGTIEFAAHSVVTPDWVRFAPRQTLSNLDS